jgi:hypothetical protein
MSFLFTVFLKQEKNTEGKWLILANCEITLRNRIIFSLGMYLETSV